MPVSPRLGSARMWTVVVALLSSALAVAAPAGRAALGFAGTNLSGRVVYATPQGSIWTVRLDGADRRKLTDGSSPQFSPDGTLIAYANARPRGIYVMRAGGSDRRRITSGPDSDPTWSPDGRYLAFTRQEGNRSAIFVVGIDGKGLTRLTSGDVQDSQPDWSPNGALITFTRTSLKRRLPEPQVMLVGESGSGLRALVAGSTPVFSPNGSQIAFTTHRGQVAVVALDGSGRKVLHAGKDPTWASDGMTIAFSLGGAGRPPSIWSIGADGTGATRLLRATSAALTWRPQPAVADWPQFGYDPGVSNDYPLPTGITAANLDTLTATQVPLQGTVDSSPIYLQDVQVDGALHNVFIVQTTYGRAYAVDAQTGDVLWQFVPPGIASWEGTDEITTASPAADPDRQYVYVATPDGVIHKVDISNGTEVQTGGWPVRIIADPTKEKISSSLAVYGQYVYAATAGLSIKIGGDTPRQGYLVAVDRTSGAISHVFNALCSNVTGMLTPADCPADRAGIWGRAPATFEPNGNALVATGNGPWNGTTDWGDSVLELSPSLGLLQNYTPADQAALNANDGDVGSVAPALIGGHYVVQAGKDGQLELLDLNLLNGHVRAAGPYLGGELQTIQAPGGYNDPGGCPVYSQPAVWQRPGQAPRLFVANVCGVAAYDLLLTPTPHLRLAWFDARAGSSPVLAGGLLYVDDVAGGGLNVYDPDPPIPPGQGREPLYSLPLAPGHWQSPVVAGGVIAVGQGDANDHQTTGVLDLYRLPPSQ